MGKRTIRAAEEADLPALVRIYNHYVVNTHITFDVVPFDAASRRPWFDSFSTEGRYRLLVIDEGDGPIGYASTGRFRTKPAYDPSVETTIYLAAEASGRGLGEPLYRALLTLVEAEPSVHRAFAGIALPNARSVALHERLGFQPIGTFGEVGFKLGQYWDVAWYQRDVSATR